MYTWTKRHKRVLALIGLSAVWFVLHLTIIVADGLRDELGRADLIVILGNRVEPDGTPSPRLAARLLRGLDLYQSGYAPRILVSGGTGVEGVDEAEAMRRWLVEQDVPASVVLVDSGGVNTFATSVNTARIMRKNGWQSAIIVSHYYHIARCKLAFARAGVETRFSAYARTGPELREPYSLVREFVAYYAYMIRSWPDTEPAGGDLPDGDAASR